MKNKKVAVVGLGYVGLPLALLCKEKGCEVFGVDMDEKKLSLINQGKSPIIEEFIDERVELLKEIHASSDASKIKDVDVVIICVPTPVDKNFYPVLKPLISALESVVANHRKGHLILVESTINPGVCEEHLMPIFENAGLKDGEDFFIAHCPERINPGDPKWNVTNINRVLGSTTKEGLKRALEFYENVIDAKIRPMKSIKEAEAAKMVENSFRDINIAFVNELAQSFDKMGIDVKDVIDGAATKPFAFMAHYPGRGVGGHCIPVDPYYLIEKAKKSGFDHKFLRIAREINNYMPTYTVELMQDLLNELELPVKNTKIGVMGLSYKANVDDLRESPAIKIIKDLEKKNANIVRFDPYILDMSDAKTVDEFLEECDALILVTNHRDFLEISPEKYAKAGVKAIVDGMNCLDGETIKTTGVKYKGIGRL